MEMMTSCSRLLRCLLGSLALPVAHAATPPGSDGDLNGSMQHSVPTHLSLKTKAKIAR